MKNRYTAVATNLFVCEEVVKEWTLRYLGAACNYKPVQYLVGANICLTCETGPYRKQVENKPTIFPIVYIVAKGSGSPSMSLIKRKVLPIDRMNPISKHVRQPIILC